MDHVIETELEPAAYARFPRRLLAMVADGALIAAAMIALFVAAASVESQSAVRAALILFALGAILYDPVLVSTTGGTLGHHWLNLRVVADESGGKLPFGRAVARGLLKTFLGIASFIFMAVTKRHQALHDMASRSTVQIRDLERAAPHHYATERMVEEPVGVSRRRRAVVITAYVLASFVVMTLASAATVSESCIMADLCTARDDLAAGVLGLAWVGVSAWTLVRGWRGRLPGARARPDTGG